MVKLSQRLKAIADQVPQAAKLADIGSDHALLPTFLVEQGRISFSIAGEYNPGPFEAAKKQVSDAGLAAAIQVRCGDGLEVVAPGEVDVITIAGMGGSLIVQILDRGINKLEGVKRLVLQPNVGEYAVRRWLVGHGWYLSSEHILEEDEKIYEILTAIRTADVVSKNEELYKDRIICGDVRINAELQFRMGPYLLRSASAAFFDKWEHELQKMEKVCSSLRRSGQDSSKVKENELQMEMEQIKEVLRCLRKDRR